MGQPLGAGGAALIEASVVICTRNRSAALREACEGALALAASFAWELVIVDNASTDDTLAVARSVARAHPGVRVEVEPTLGLSAARNLGVRLARGAWIAFLDDDALPGPSWLEAYRTALAAPGVLAAGGPIDPLYGGALPDWFEPHLALYLAAWDRGETPHRLEYNEYPRGANMAFRREAFARCGDFDRRLGRSGGSLRSCEEIELCLRIERAGGAIVYAPGARVRHRVETARLTPGWMATRFRAQGFSEAIVEWKHFGLAGLRRGLAAQRAAATGSNTAGSDLLPGFRREAWRGYRRGAAYAALAVPRWDP